MHAFLSCIVLGLAAIFGADELDEIFRLFMEGKAEVAAARAQEYVQAHPDDAGGYHALGRICFHLDQHDDAITHLQRCLELGPEEAWMIGWSHTVLGQAYAAKGDEGAAKEHLKKAIELAATGNSVRQAQRALQQLTGEAPPSPWVGKPMPDFELHGLAGETFRPAELRGSPCLYKFGPSW
jgi:tetratricopeptide (TPR) repeat protein